MKSLSAKPVAYTTPLLLLAALPIAAAGPWSVLWTAPSIRPNNTVVVGDRTGKILVLGEA